MPSWSRWRSCRPCWGLPPRPAGCVTPTGICGTCFPTCPASPATTSGCAAPASCCATSSEQWPPIPRCGAATSGWWTPPRWSVAARGRRSSARRLPGGRSMATAPAIHAGFGGLRLHLVCTLGGLPVAFALAGAKQGEQEVLLDLFATEPELVAARPGQVLIADKNYFGGEFERMLAGLDLHLLRPARKGETERAGAHLFKPLRQLIESVNQTFKGQLDLERHGGRTGVGVAVRVLQRILAVTTAIWHNDKTGQATLRSLVAYDH